MKLLEITQAVVPDQSALDLVMKGGVTMIVLLILCFWGTFVFIERYLTIKKAKKSPKELLKNVKSAVLQGDMQRAIDLCNEDGTPMAKMLKAGVKHIGSPLKNIEVAIENVGKIELYNLEKHVGVLGTISGAAPMIGFLGTVIGMITAFRSLAGIEQGAVDAQLLSTGIYEAMVTTAGGLIVGILAYITYNYLVRQVAEVVHQMEVTSIEFIDLLQQPNPKKAERV
ncbi:MotA/TolQ/ExbB proton channel family protein [Sediminitomix flava]|uniref:Outer membrane transport energization protein ExbB n=1 Tax=Sediminitomix flava TaxID=379075 RepID=A0A315Z9T4_SEDFL|nr:MotA/TolQ/ExbB proton channel family protein [Sediminitomix flava]PWJ42291.1 outer membrane transport energization protein ExbB [Sediminitomix flava]